MIRTKVVRFLDRLDSSCERFPTTVERPDTEAPHPVSAIDRFRLLERIGEGGSSTV